MKKSLTAIAFALPLLAASSFTLADYQIRIGVETPQGGSLPQGSISFSNGGAVTPPVEPSAPANPDPFEPEDKRCDPYATTYPENYWGRDSYPARGVMLKNGQIHYACKLKPVDKPNLIARYMSGISGANAGALATNGCLNASSTDATCFMNLNLIQWEFKIIRNNGNVTFQSYPLIIYKDDFFKEYGQYPQRIVIDGMECKDFKPYRLPFVKTWVTCEFDTSMDWIESHSGRPFVIEVYSQ